MWYGILYLVYRLCGESGVFKVFFSINLVFIKGFLSICSKCFICWNYFIFLDICEGVVMMIFYR